MSQHPCHKLYRIFTPQHWAEIEARVIQGKYSAQFWLSVVLNLIIFGIINQVFHYATMVFYIFKRSINALHP